MTAVQDSDKRQGTSQRSAITSLLAVIGTVIILGVVAIGVLNAVSASQVRDYEPQTLFGGDSNHLKMDVAAGNVTVACGESDDFVLTQQKVTAKWTLNRDGNAIVVSRERHKRFFNISLFGPRNKYKATLTIPKTACQQNMIADLKLSAGQLKVDARFEELNIEVSAGSAAIKGEANKAKAKVSAGSLEVILGGVKQADLNVQAGNLTGKLIQVPERMKVDVSTGDVDLTLPPGNYNVNSEIKAGTFHNRLTVDTHHPKSHIEIRVGAGSVNLN